MQQRLKILAKIFKHFPYMELIVDTILTVPDTMTGRHACGE
jgi:hypothetical protein